ncbi:unnamed protein product [Cylicocyclus nassatus]|uniref:Uncharacterized protein n=1 Tax=Cylicocyclus nassatus TaxID=53992 RepID=A0AA36MD69_CYLNA|nr:unnamed protein product [Cylicocyclus nassatus]
MLSHALFLLAVTITAISADDELEFHHPRRHKHRGPHSELPGPQGLKEHHHNGPHPLGSHVSRHLENSELLKQLLQLSPEELRKRVIPRPGKTLIRVSDEEDGTYPRAPWLDVKRRKMIEGGDTIALGKEKKTKESKKWKPSQAKQGEVVV